MKQSSFDDNLEMYEVFYEELGITYVTDTNQPLQELTTEDSETSLPGLSVEQVSQIAQDSMSDTQAGTDLPSDDPTEINLDETEAA